MQPEETFFFFEPSEFVATNIADIAAEEGLAEFDSSSSVFGQTADVLFCFVFEECKWTSARMSCPFPHLAEQNQTLQQCKAAADCSMLVIYVPAIFRCRYQLHFLRCCFKTTFALASWRL